MPPRVKIDFYFDVGSPYSYLAIEILCRYENLWNLDIDLKPVFLGAVFKLTGNSSPATSPYKAAHMWNDLERLSQQCQIPFGPGPEFPGNTLNVMRLLRYLKTQLAPDRFKEATRHYFRENFVVNTPLSSPKFIASISPSILSASALEDALNNHKSVTETMRAEAASLVERHGAFGFPWIVVKRADNETANFWGSDRFSNVAWWLGPEYAWFGPVPPTSSL